MNNETLTVKRLLALFKAGGPQFITPENHAALVERAENETVVKLLFAALAVTKAEAAFVAAVEAA